MTLESLIYIVEGYLLYPASCKKISDIKIDSRLIQKNDVFIAIKGENHNGFDYIDDVVRKGCSVLILETIPNKEYDIPIIIVKSTYDALLRVALFKRQQSKVPVIAVTGSVGKSSTKELLYQILSNKYKVLKSEGSQNNRLGVPLSLLKIDESYDFVIVEMGMNHLGEINVLTNYTKPDIAIITNIGSAHIGNLGTIDNILKAKMEITNSMHKGVLLLNGNDCLLNGIVSNKLEIIKCGFLDSHQLYAYDLKGDLSGSSFKIKVNKNEYSFDTKIPGIPFINNILLAIQIGIMYNIKMHDIINSISEYQPLKRRLNIKDYGSTTIIDDCYNASYESLMMVLNLLKEEKREKIIILGDILELGPYSEEIHKRIKDELEKISNAIVITVGDAMREVGINFNSNKMLIDYLKNIDFSNKLVLLKGSRRMKLEEVKDEIIKNFI